MLNDRPQVRSDWLQSYHVPHGILAEFHDNSQKLRGFFIKINVEPCHIFLKITWTLKVSQPWEIVGPKRLKLEKIVDYVSRGYSMYVIVPESFDTII